MEFTFFNPVKIHFGECCIEKNKGLIQNLFKKNQGKAMLVTGKHSAKKSGALGDITGVLESSNIPYVIYDEVSSNPTMACVTEASKIAREAGVTFVIGIGGGSPIDAAKAIAVLAANTLSVEDLFLNSFENALPIIAVPTTSGTGSEATPYAVLVNEEKETKMSFGNALTYPEYAFLDARYTYSLSYDFTVFTAIDAFTHVFEGYLANRSTPLSKQLSAEGMRVFGLCLPKILSGEIDEDIREKLMYVSLLGGMVIAQTGVTIVHGMGYSYTYFDDIPHGKANGLLLKPFLEYMREIDGEPIDEVLKIMGIASVDAFNEMILKLVGESPTLDDGMIEKYTKLSLIQKGSVANTPGGLSENGIRKLWLAASQKKAM